MIYFLDQEVGKIQRRSQRGDGAGFSPHYPLDSMELLGRRRGERRERTKKMGGERGLEEDEEG